MNQHCFVFLIVINLCYGLPSKDVCDGQKCTVEQCKSKTSNCCSNWYYKKNIGKCAPHCFNGCKDGECTAPNTCTCTLPRILHKNKKMCVIPKCEDCSNGRCVSDNICECNEGYVTNGKSCRPICDHCENGDCVKPKTCECHSGYTKNNKNECKPICTNPCVNSTCASPDTCKCDPGFEKTELDHICKPICKQGCKNGACVGPNKCSCNEGYKAIESQSKCEPVCENCGNGTCHSPNNCTCNIDFERFNDICIPTCKSKCKHGSCVGPNKCSCNKGYKAIESQSKCEPVCENCGNGTCHSPNNCTCNKDFERFNDICVPTCKSKCEYGICVGPNKCSCNEGYKAIESQSKCDPVCENCGNGTCHSPNNCTCNKGFERFNDICVPTCKSKCEYGICVGPNKCSCNEGYKAIESQSKCDPVCENCGNGTCHSPNNCTCNKGFEKNNDICIPTCELCEFGICIGPNNCECHSGYERSKVLNICQRKCEDICQNGLCVSGECTCYSGYQLINSSCEPIPKSDCYNDSCMCEGQPCMPPEAEETKMASAGIPWIVGGLILIIFILLIAVIGTIYRLNKRGKNKQIGSGPEVIPFGSIVYTKPGTLINSDPEIEAKIDNLLHQRPESDEET